MYGLSAEDLKFIIEFAEQHSDVLALGIFGSRARGDFSNTSDVDIVIKGSSIEISLIGEAESYLDTESPFPYFVDVIHYESITDINLKNEIDRDTVWIYQSKL